MSRKRGRPRKRIQIRVDAIRRTPPDYAALARAVLEQAAIDAHAKQQAPKKQTAPKTKPQEVNDDAVA